MKIAYFFFFFKWNSKVYRRTRTNGARLAGFLLWLTAPLFFPPLCRVTWNLLGMKSQVFPNTVSSPQFCVLNNNESKQPKAVLSLQVPLRAISSIPYSTAIKHIFLLKKHARVKSSPAVLACAIKPWSASFLMGLWDQKHLLHQGQGDDLSERWKPCCLKSRDEHSNLTFFQ